MQTVALLPHTGKEEAMALAKRLLRELKNRGISIWMDPEVSPLVGYGDESEAQVDLGACDVALVLGGDGALLNAARLVAPFGVPILGVNLGHLGFLTEVEPKELFSSLDDLFAGHYSIEERMMLRAEVIRDGKIAASFFGLNDAVVTRGVFARVIELETYVNQHPVDRFLGDGIIISTPTGSTAYNLSAGGPIVNPNIEALIMTPICPHTVGTRTLITCPGETISIRLTPKADDAMLTVDGQVGQELKPGDEVRVRRAGKPARLVKVHPRTFYQLLYGRFLRESGRTRIMPEL